jgi:hypothetical protein
MVGIGVKIRPEFAGAQGVSQQLRLEQADASHKAVWGQSRGRRGGGIDLSFVRVADEPPLQLELSSTARAAKRRETA